MTITNIGIPPTSANARMICKDCLEPISRVLMTTEPRGENEIVLDYFLEPCGHHAPYLMVPIGQEPPEEG